MVKKKMKLPFLDKKSTEMRSSSSSWPWPSCHQPRTLSFRANSADMFSTVNSDPTSAEVDPVETVVRGLQSDRRRLFFEPDETSSILETKAISAGGRVPFKDSFVLSMESRDPYLDFRKSMEEMVEAHALRHLEALQELLCWYLRLNAKSNHVCILSAFVDLLLDLAPPHSSPCASSPLSFSASSSLSSSFSTHCVNYSSLEPEEVEVDATDDDDPASTSQVHDKEATCLNA